MRRSNWKGKVLMAVAILIGIICALAVTIAIPEGYSQYRGLTFFGAFILVAGIIIVLGTKISDWGGLVKMKKKERKQNMGRKGRTFLSIVGMAALHSLLIGVQVMAAPQDGSAIIESGFDVVYTIIAAIVSAVGSLLLLWGLFEWAQALNTQDGGAQSMAFKRIASGLVACMGPQLIPLIQAGFSR